VHRFVPPHVNAAEQIVQLRLQTVKALTGAIVYPMANPLLKDIRLEDGASRNQH
jgi:hypothetical protein